MEREQKKIENEKKNQEINKSIITTTNITNVTSTYITNTTKEKEKETYKPKKLIEINDEGKVELSNIAKDISNKIVYIYDNLVTAINEQRCENLKLQLEISKITKEKNNLRHEVELLTEAVRKLEVSLGVEQNPPFEKMLEYSTQSWNV